MPRFSSENIQADRHDVAGYKCYGGCGRADHSKQTLYNHRKAAQHKNYTPIPIADYPPQTYTSSYRPNKRKRESSLPPPEVLHRESDAADTPEPTDADLGIELIGDPTTEWLDGTAFGLDDDTDLDSEGDTPDSEHDESNDGNVQRTQLLTDAPGELLEDERIDDSQTCSGLSAWDRLGERWETSASDRRQENGLPQDEITVIKAVSFMIRHHITQEWDALPDTFESVELPSLACAFTYIRNLSGITPVFYDCCRDSCCAFTGELSNLEKCPHCGLARQNPKTNRPYKVFAYIPLLPQIKAQYQNPKLAEAMRYRANHQRNYIKGSYQDIPDGSLYRCLLKHHVRVDERKYKHKYFQDERDVAIGISTDGFAPFKSRKHSAWPIIYPNYNLDPDICSLLEYILCGGVIPGPRTPKNMNSFIHPLVEELLILAVGTCAFDVGKKELFALRVYPVIGFGDMPAVAKLIYFVGHTGICNCWWCRVRGVRIPNKSRVTTHYTPLDRQNHPDNEGIDAYDPLNLPMRSHKRIIQQGREVVEVSKVNKARAKALASQYGFKGVTELARLGSISLPFSFPIGFMHAVLEHTIKNVILHWTGGFKDLGGDADADYRLETALWKALGKRGHESGDTIPSQFGARVPDISMKMHEFTAENWCFWVLYLGAPLLRNCFKRREYYNHFIALVKLVELCIQFEITAAEVIEIREGFAAWVKEYERLYYKFDPQRVSACPATLHGLLHIADGIVAVGPLCRYWEFMTERWCGFCARAVKGRRFPWANINEFVTHTTQLYAIKAIHNLDFPIAFGSSHWQKIDAPIYNHYPYASFMPPHRVLAVDSAVKKRIARHIATAFPTIPFQVALQVIPDKLEQWGKVRRLYGGDVMHASALVQRGEDYRDASFIKYNGLIDKQAHRRNAPEQLENGIFYGQLLNIFVVPLPTSPNAANDPSPLILAHVHQCKTETHQRTPGLISYKTMAATPEVVDLSLVQSVVGRMADGKDIFILDRSGPLANVEYV